MATTIVFETHSITARAVETVTIAFGDTMIPVLHDLNGASLSDLLAADFAWQPGWEYVRLSP